MRPSTSANVWSRSSGTQASTRRNTTLEALADLDQLHVEGHAATTRLARLAAVTGDDLVPDVCCGMAGPARSLRRRSAAWSQGAGEAELAAINFLVNARHAGHSSLTVHGLAALHKFDEPRGLTCRFEFAS